MSRESRLINSMQPKKGSVAREMILPNTSGDHVKGIKRQVPIDDADLVNKKYVDDAGQWIRSSAPDWHLEPKETGDDIQINFDSNTTGQIVTTYARVDNITYAQIEYKVLDDTVRANKGEINFYVEDGAGNLSKEFTINAAALDAVTKKILNVVDPTLDQDAATKKYVDDQFPITHASTTGQTPTDHHDNSTDHTQNTDTALGAQSENLDMNTHKVVGVVDPTLDQDAATKKYVDDNATTLWEVDGTETQLITADAIDMRSQDILNAKDITVSGSVDGVDIAGQAVFVTANSNHRVDNSQAHTDYLINNGDDTTTGKITTIAPTSDLHCATKKYHDDHVFVDAGDSSNFDFTLAGTGTLQPLATNPLTTDMTWRDLDLSALVPAGAKAVMISAVIQDGLVNQRLHFRNKDNANVYNSSRTRTQAANVINDVTLLCGIDSDRVMQFRAENTVWTALNINIMGWIF